MLKSALLFLLIFFVFPKDCAVIYDLGGSWTVSDLNGEYQDLPASVPGGIYSDLMQNSVIPDVFSGYNDVESRWVSKRDWKYQRNFTIPQNLLLHQRINLVFDGIDTFATVQINDQEILNSDNMFVQYVVDVTSYLKTGENFIQIVFKSAVEEAQRLYEEQLKDYEVVPTCVPDDYNGECHVNHIRKMQASFSWDWGPALPSVGIWKPIYLEAYNSTTIRDVTVATTFISSTSSWDVSLKIYFEATPNNQTVYGTVATNLNTDVTTITELFDVVLNNNENGETIAELNFSIPTLQVSLWWPNGYGAQNLYALNVSFTSNDGETTAKNIKIGFRTVKLIQDEIEGGRAFYFEINNVAIFAKGSNSIPINILPERGQNEEVIRFLLQSAKDVHMNMLRVWGGGVYESDVFYEIADELGILIWQDFMFACAMYPTKINYLNSVRQEVRHQVRRLQHHASIALWAANNENEAALRDNWYGTGTNFELYAKDYVELYVNTVRDEAIKNDETRDFLTSSPTNGIESENEGYVAKNPYSLFYGDGDRTKIPQVESWNKNNYPRTRFASEYGFQAMPQLESWLSVTDSVANLHPDSEFLKHRQHLPLGNDYFKLLITYELSLPNINSSNYVNAFIFYSQIIQAVAIKYESEYYRQWRSVLNSDSTGLTMGALYWQLNDVWVAPTWAGIDFQNRWKMMHYYAKDFFAPIIVTGHLTAARELDVYLVSDVLTTFYNVTLTINVYNWSSLKPVFVQKVITDIWSNVSRKIFSIWLDHYLASMPGCQSNSTENTECFIYFTLADANDSFLAPNNFVFPAKLKNASLVKPNLQISSVVQTDADGREFIVSVTTDVVALFVWLDSASVNGRFSENGFLQVQANKNVTFYSNQATNTQTLLVNLSITNLLDDKYL